MRHDLERARVVSWSPVLQGVVVPPFDNVAVYPLLCAALGIAPLAGDWSAAELPAVLARPAAP